MYRAYIQYRNLIMPAAAIVSEIIGMCFEYCEYYELSCKLYVMHCDRPV